jgi:transcriptional regulator with XRE-family HTH domain
MSIIKSNTEGGDHMGWDGSRIKVLSKERHVPLVQLAEHLKVSRQTVNDWMNGQVPKGTHLVELCRFLNVSPSSFFPEDPVPPISRPLHRIKGAAKLNEAMDKGARELASDYEGLFRFAPSPGLVPVLRGGKDKETACTIAQELRSRAQIDPGKPMGYEHTFNLLEKLNIVCIFREFHAAIKSYALYCRIHNHRVVFINTKTNILDLIFPLLHETMHAVRDGEGATFYDKDEEDFCDIAAGYTQFPDTYVDMVFDFLKGKTPAQQINTLKMFSRNYGHSIFGIYTRIKSKHENIDLRTGGADTNLKKEFPSIGDILFKSDEPHDYIQHLRKLSPLFFDIVSRQIDNPSTRKFGEWLGLDTTLDAEHARKEWRKILDCM